MLTAATTDEGTVLEGGLDTLEWETGGQAEDGERVQMSLSRRRNILKPLT